MAQQINLYSPILLAPRRHFSAQAMLQAVAVLCAGLAALGGWTVWQTVTLRHNLAAATAADEAERQRLAASLAARQAPASTAALTQELAHERTLLDARRQRLAQFGPWAGGGEQQGDGAALPPRRSALLRLLAQTAPASLWLTEVRLLDHRVEFAGMALQPEALRPWLARLEAEPALAGQTLAAVRVERSDAPGATAAAGGPVWAFRVASSRPAVDALQVAATSAPAAPTPPGTVGAAR